MILAEFVGGGSLDGASLVLETADMRYRDHNAEYAREIVAETQRTQDGMRVWRYSYVGDDADAEKP